MSLDALEDGIVLAVDREDARPVAQGLPHHEFSRQDEDLLRCERQVFSRGDRGEGRLEASRADDCDEDGVGIRQRRQFRETGGPRQESRVPCELSGIALGFGTRLLVVNRNVADAEFPAIECARRRQSDFAGDAGTSLEPRPDARR